MTSSVLYCSSSSATVVGACCISMSRGILRVLGSSNSCGKHFRFSQHLSFSSLIGMSNMAVTAAVQSMGMNSVRTSFRSPWQNGIVER